MLQRIQTIFMVIVAFLVLALVFANTQQFNVWSKYDEKTGNAVVLGSFTLKKTHFDQATKTETVLESYTSFPIGLVAIIALGVAVYCIFRYDNRLLQMKLSLLNSFILTALLGVMWYYSLSGEALLKEPAEGQFGLAFLIPAFSLLINMTANRFIRKDEDLVRSSDRIR